MLYIGKIMDRIELLSFEVVYEAPIVEIVEVQVEKGFEGSDMKHYSPADGNGGWS
mgnify:FL=1